MVNASAKTVSNHMDPVALTLTSVELNQIFAAIMRTASMLPVHSDVNVCPVMWEHHHEFNVRHHAKMLNVDNTRIVNQMAPMLIAFVKKVGRTIPKILLPVVLKSMNVTLPVNVLVLLASLVRVYLYSIE